MARNRTLGAIVTAAVTVAALPAAAQALFGTQPLSITNGHRGGAPDGPSGHPSVSGDNRRGRYTAFDSKATNLVAGDTNSHQDVFLWSRPKGQAGLTLQSAGHRLRRISVSSSARQGNGDSSRPSVDGSTYNVSHCVAFQSEASNLADGDHDHISDIFLRDLSSGRTTLISRGISPAATRASIDGHCEKVAFQAGGAVYVAPVSGGAPQRVGAGQTPDLSLDSTALTWEHGGHVWLQRNGNTSDVGPGEHPTVSDNDQGKWGVTFESHSRLAGNDHNSSRDVYMRVLRDTDHVIETDLISASRRGGHSLGGASYNGGISAYGPTRGIVTFVNDHGRTSDLYYRNNHTGNIDDLAHATSNDSRPAITDVVSSSRVNFVAFSSAAIDSGPQRVFFKHLVDGDRL